MRTSTPWCSTAKTPRTAGFVASLCQIALNNAQRKQQLQYFGENLADGACDGYCDVCLRGEKFVLRDVTDEVKGMLRLIRKISGDISATDLVDLFLVC